MRSSISKEKDQSERYSEYKAFAEDKYYILKVYDFIKKFKAEFVIHKSLDVGCADGSFSKKLREDFNFEVYGVDISEKAIALARSNGVNASVCDLEKELPFPDGNFDLVFACEVIEHIYDTDFFIDELARVLKKGGLIILSTPNLVSMTNRIKILLGKYPRFVPEYKVGGAGHIRAYTIPVLIDQLESHGLKVIAATSPNITFPITNKNIPEVFKRAAYKLGDVFPKIGSHMIIVAKK